MTIMSTISLDNNNPRLFVLNGHMYSIDSPMTAEEILRYFVDCHDIEQLCILRAHAKYHLSKCNPQSNDELFDARIRQILWSDVNSPAIEAIKYARNTRGWSLKAAKDYVDELKNKL